MNLIIEHRDPEAARALQDGFESHPYLEARLHKRWEPGVSPGVDASYVPIHAFEQVPPARLLIHQAHVFRTRQVFYTEVRDVTKGWPPLLISGFVSRQDEDASDPRYLSRLVKAVIAAVRRFNAQGQDVIETISLDWDWLHMDKLAPDEAAHVIRAAYDDAMAVPEDKLDEYGRVKPHIIATVGFVTTTGTRTRNEWRCALEFQGKRSECALILEELPPLGIGENEGVPIEFLCPKTDRPQLRVCDAFTLWEGRKRIAKGIVDQVL